MQFKIRRSALAPWLALVFAVALVMQPGFTQAATAGGRLRFVHAVPGAPAVDVAIDNQPAVLALNYATNTRYLNLAPGNHAISVMATGTTSAVFKGQVTLAAGQSQTAVLQGTATALEMGFYEDDLGPVAPGNIRFTAIHAIKDAPAVDILKADGSPLIQGLKYGAPYGGFDVPAAAASILVVPAGGNPSGAIIKADSLSLVAGTFNTLVALGTVSGSVKPSFLLVSSAADEQQPGSSAWVSFVNAAVGGKSVDVYLGDKLIVPALAFGAITPHVALAPTGVITVRAAGGAATDPALATVPALGIAAGSAGTVAINTAADGSLAASAIADNIATLDPKTARVNVINLAHAAQAAPSGKATLAFGTTSVVTDSSKPSTSAEIPAGTYDVAVTVDTPAIQTVIQKFPLSGGVLYDLVVAGDGNTNKLIYGTTGINEQVSSVPLAVSGPVAQNATPVPPAAATQAAAPTQTGATPTSIPIQPQANNPTPVVAATTVPATPVPPTPVPPTATQAQPAPTGQQPPAVTPTATPGTGNGGAATDQSASQPTDNQASPTPEGPYAIVIINLDKHLVLREYPRSNARTIYLVPSGAQMQIVGVRVPLVGTVTPGAPVPANVTVTPGPTPTLSTKGAEISSTWLWVTYTPPSGSGSVSGWVFGIDQYFEVHYKTRKLHKFEEILPLIKEISADTPGVDNTGATPVPDANQLVGTIVNLDNGVNANLRRTPDLQGEVIASIPLSDQVIVLEKTDVAASKVVGAPSSTTWFRAQYTKDQNVCTGWVSAQYVQVTRRGRKVDMTEIPTATSIARGDCQTSGGVSVAPAAPPAAAGLVATVSGVNQDAHLNLRDKPNANGNVLASIGAGEQLQVQGRTGDGLWLEVTYQGQTGWIASQTSTGLPYVTLTKNGKPYKLQDVTIVNGQTNSLSTPTPTPHS